MTKGVVTGDRTSGESITRRRLLRAGPVLLGSMGLTSAAVAAAPAASAAGLGWTSIQYRSVDTRISGGRLYVGQSRAHDLTDDINGFYRIPGAVAVSFNLTVTQTAGAGYLSIYQEGTAWPGVSSLNWKRAGEDIANGGMVGLGGGGPYFARVRCGGNSAASTHYVIDITGYFA